MGIAFKIKHMHGAIPHFWAPSARLLAVVPFEPYLN